MVAPTAPACPGAAGGGMDSSAESCVIGAAPAAGVGVIAGDAGEGPAIGPDVGAGGSFNAGLVFAALYGSRL